MSGHMVPSEIVLVWDTSRECYEGSLYVYGRRVFTRHVSGHSYNDAEELFADEVAEQFRRFFGETIEN